MFFNLKIPLTSDKPYCQKKPQTRYAMKNPSLPLANSRPPGVQDQCIIYSIQFLKSAIENLESTSISDLFYAVNARREL